MNASSIEPWVSDGIIVVKSDQVGIGIGKIIVNPTEHAGGFGLIHWQGAE
jgi:hypothetical protein